MRHLRRAVAVAVDAGLSDEEARSRVSLAGALALRGEQEAAAEQLDVAAPHLRGLDLARLHLQRANLFLVQGRPDDALAGYRIALRSVRRTGAVEWEAAVLNNRGLVHAQRGATAAARADLERAESLYDGLGQRRAAAEARQNLGFVAARAGDIQGALRWYERADEFFHAEGVVDAVGLRDRCETLLAARLADEARSTAEAAVTALGEQGMASYRAEALLMSAEAHILCADAEAARAAATEARTLLVRQRRPGWVARAWCAVLEADRLTGDCTPAMLARARRAATALEAAGWTVAALDARIAAGRLALDLGRRAVARHELAHAAEARRRGTAELRARAWHAVALLRLADGNRRGAESALRAGVDVLDRHRAALGATELRASVSGHAAELAALGLRLALADGRPERVLAWAERWRAGSLRVRSTTSPIDDALRELRGASSPVRQAELEATVRRRARLAPAVVAADDAAGPPSIEDVADALGDRVLVEIVQADGALHGIALRRGALVLREVAATAEVDAEVASLRFALRRLAHGHGSSRSRGAAVDALAHAGKQLDDLLLSPFDDVVGDRSLVVVPTGSLHALPWSTLPSLRERPVTVAPSTSLWLRAERAPATGYRSIVLVAGPGLPHAAAEVHALASVYESARLLHGAAASVDAVRAAIDGARLAHVAAHGRFRADNPLFSSLQLHDGPLTVYDIEQLRRAPRTLVLSACDAGLSAVHPGDELMGMAAALLGAGTRTVVAGVVPVPDATTEPLMLSLHAALRQGRPVADALARARVEAGADEPAAAGFVCFGAS